MNKGLGVALSLSGLAFGVAVGAWFGPAWRTAGDAAAGGHASGPPQPQEREVLYWVAPMDANYRRDKPGKSPMGMDLTPVYADAVDAEPGTVTITPGVAQNLGVRVAKAQQGPLSPRIETVGYVEYDEEALHHIHTRVEGWVEALGVRALGDPVQAGQMLVRLYAPELVNAQDEYLTAQRSGYGQLLAAARERLATLGMTEREIKRLHSTGETLRQVSIFAPSNGVVVGLGVREGVHVTPATHVLSIAEPDRVWVLAEVFERQAALVAPGDKAEFELGYLPGRRWSGTVDYIYPELDAKTRTLKVRIRATGDQGVLRPNMFTRVTIFAADLDADGNPTQVLHVPREALIRGGDGDRVVLALGGGRFRSQTVTAGREAGERMEIRAGIKAGDEVVVSGQFLIDSESNIETALTRMER